MYWRGAATYGIIIARVRMENKSFLFFVCFFGHFFKNDKKHLRMAKVFFVKF